MSSRILALLIVLNSLHPPRMEKGKTLGFLMMVLVYMRTVLAPEFLVSAAVTEYIKADKITDDFKKLGIPRWSSTHSFVLKMQGFAVLDRQGNFHETVDTEKLRSLIQNKSVEDSDIPLSDEVMESSRTSRFDKALGVFQIVWVVTQCIARASQLLSVTLIELLTCGYIFCGSLAYLFWLHKPYKMDSRPIIIRSRKSQVTPYVGFIRKIFRALVHLLTFFHIPSKYYGYVAEILTFLVLSVIHLSAWNYIFPTKAEQYLWRITTILHLVTVLKLFYLAPLKGIRGCGITFNILAIPIYALLVLFRIILITLALISMRSLPAGAYIEPSWTHWIPHVQ
ncbi:hypothetical protein DL96DRAFT_1774412 [Flagelloscypha sp. PMI_526]|nr:hypothetical protein DL96DRAFT_1774412 [Flagelloscypha sp. PMI_526]